MNLQFLIVSQITQQLTITIKAFFLNYGGGYCLKKSLLPQVKAGV
jgi:hypothetical protein